MILFLMTFLVVFIWQKKGISNTSAKLCFLVSIRINGDESSNEGMIIPSVKGLFVSVPDDSS